MAEDGGWTVLVVLGPSGVGKSRAARSIAQTRGCTWLQVDDLRLALHASPAILPDRADRLCFFERAPDVWHLPAAVLRDAIIDVAHLMMPAVRVVIDGHIATGAPAVIEGDGILPALSGDPVLRRHLLAGKLRFCCVVPDGIDELLENTLSRGRGIEQLAMGERIRQAEMNVAFGEWLRAECACWSGPVVRSRPLATLPRGITAAITASDG